MASTASRNNPGYYEITTQQFVPGPTDPATGFRSGTTVTQVQTFNADGKLAYTETVNPDGSRTLVGSVGGEIDKSDPNNVSGAYVATPDGRQFKRSDGTVVDPTNPTITHATPGEAVADIKAGNTTIADDLLKAKTLSEKLNLVGMATGTQAPGFDNNKINNTIGNYLGGTAAQTPGSGSQTTTTGGGGNGMATPPTGDLTQVDKDRTAARTLQDALLNQYNTGTGATAPTAAKTTLAPAAASAAPSWAPLATASAPGPVAASHVDPMTFSGPMSAGAGSSGSAAQAATAQADPATTYAGATIDKTASDEMRARQITLADALTAAMNGQGPSVAQEQLKMGLEDALKMQSAMAASSRGQNVGLGQYQAAQNAGTISAQVDAEAARLRAQEIAQARGQLGGVLDSTRGQDIGLATNQANFINQAGMFSAGEINKNNQFNTGQTNQVGMFNAGEQNQNSRLDAQLGTQASIASMTSGNQYNAQMNALAQALAVQNGQWTQDTSLFNSKQAQDLGIFNTGQTNDYNKAMALAIQQNNQFNTGQTNDLAKTQGGFDSARNIADLNAAVSTNSINSQDKNALLSALLQGQGQMLSTDSSIYNTQAGGSTQLNLAGMNADLQKYLQQQGFNQANSYNTKDIVNAITAFYTMKGVTG